MPHLDVHKHADTSGKRLPNGTWPLTGVEITSEPPATHAFSRTYIDLAMAEGWVSMVKGNIVLDTITGDLVYRITEAPGRYEDAAEPAGYRVSNEYKVELVSAPPLAKAKKGAK